MTVHPMVEALALEIEQAIILLRQQEWDCLWSNHFASSDQFAEGLESAKTALLAGKLEVLADVRDWFLPTSDWDEVVGAAGDEIADRIEGLIDELWKKEL